MLRGHASLTIILGSLLICGTARAEPPKADIFLKYRPKQEGVPYSVPDAKDVDACKVEAIKGQGKGAGWLLRDPQGRPLRRFFDSQYDGIRKTGIDVWAYYQEGVETYREQYVNTAGEPDQMHYRWLNHGGSKWGVDLNKDGKIDTWKVISPEEVSQEIVQALVKNDFARIQALMPTDAELKELPADLGRRARDGRAAAETKFKATQAKLALTDKAHWLHLETEAPHLIPSDGGHDILEHAHATIVIDTAGKNDWIQTGELVFAGSAWRILEAPAPGAMDSKAGPMGNDNPELQKLLGELGALDGDFSKKTDTKPADMVKYNLDRTNLIEKIIAAVKSDDERGQWIRQEADCLSAAAQNSAADDKTAFQRLTGLVGQVQKAMPAGDALSAYVTFREMQAWYFDQTRPNQKDYDFKKVHEAWVERLAKFAKDYPASDDAPEALLGAGWVNETLGKEAEAKKWYEQLAKDFADKPQGAKAKGAIRRLALEGNELALTGATLDGGSFELGKLRDKVVIVYYWYTFNGGPVGDFAKLKLLLDSYASKGLELVTISLDGSAREAAEFVKKTNAPGTHLYQEGGMESKYAVDYGVMMLPQLFLVGKDGKVVSRSLQVNGLEEEIKKQLAK